MATTSRDPKVKIGPPPDNTVFLDGVPVGHVSETGLVYITTRDPEHFFVKYQGFAVSTEVHRILSWQGIKFIKIIYNGTRGKKTLMSSLSKWHPVNGLAYHVHEPPYDAQYCLPQKEMEELPETTL